MTLLEAAKQALEALGKIKELSIPRYDGTSVSRWEMNEVNLCCCGAWAVKNSTNLRAAIEQADKAAAPNKEQLTQILNGLDRCPSGESKREFLRIWIRDFAQHASTPAIEQAEKIGSAAQQPEAKKRRPYNE